MVKTVLLDLAQSTDSLWPAIFYTRFTSPPNRKDKITFFVKNLTHLLGVYHLDVFSFFELGIRLLNSILTLADLV